MTGAVPLSSCGVMEGLEEALCSREIFALAFDHAPPAEIALQVARRDALEVAQSLLQPADVGVDVLNVIAAVGALGPAGVERDVQHVRMRSNIVAKR